MYHDVAVRYVGLPDAIEQEVTSAGFEILRSELFVDGGTDELVLVARKPE